ncbi:MAG: MFS transporter, partial [Acetobacteraceae bacterium]|nr:MFS transporter [Acetobacteraceae bacterium]
MLAASTARLLASRGIHYGWLMLALTFGFVIASSGVSSIPSVLLLPISKEFGWSIGELSGPLGLRMALFGLVAPFAGSLMVLYGPRNVLMGAAALLIAGLILA